MGKRVMSGLIIHLCVHKRGVCHCKEQGIDRKTFRNDWFSHYLKNPSSDFRVSQLLCEALDECKSSELAKLRQSLRGPEGTLSLSTAVGVESHQKNLLIDFILFFLYNM